MKKSGLIIVSAVLLFSSCAKEFNRVYKSDNYAYKYEYAKECFAQGKYVRAISLLEGIVTMLKGSQNGQESLYMLAMAEYNNKDYETAAEYFKKYYTSYPRGNYAELAKFYVGQSLYMSTPEPRLDQSQTLSAISAFQEYLDVYPLATQKEAAQDRLFALQDKLVRKELHSAQLYYDLGTYTLNSIYGGNNYEACFVTAQNALKDYPYASAKLREDLSFLSLRAKYQLARQSVEEKRVERFRDTIDEYYSFQNDFPESEYLKEAQSILSHSERIVARKGVLLKEDEDEMKKH